MPYLIDGNNVLGGAAPGGERDPRAELVPRIAEFCRRRGARATLVFDGRPFRQDVAGDQSLGRVTVRFADAEGDADAVILGAVETHPRPAELTVVTSDKPLSDRCRARGARVMKVHEFRALERRVTSRVAAGGDADDEKPEREPDVEGWLRIFGEVDDS